jgi:hypothetical protein
MSLLLITVVSGSTTNLGVPNTVNTGCSKKESDADINNLIAEIEAEEKKLTNLEDIGTLLLWNKEGNPALKGEHKGKSTNVAVTNLIAWFSSQLQNINLNDYSAEKVNQLKVIISLKAKITETASGSVSSASVQPRRQVPDFSGNNQQEPNAQKQEKARLAEDNKKQLDAVKKAEENTKKAQDKAEKNTTDDTLKTAAKTAKTAEEDLKKKTLSDTVKNINDAQSKLKSEKDANKQKTLETGISSDISHALNFLIHATVSDAHKTIIQNALTKPDDLKTTTLTSYNEALNAYKVFSEKSDTPAKEKEAIKHTLAHLKKNEKEITKKLKQPANSTTNSTGTDDEELKKLWDTSPHFIWLLIVGLLAVGASVYLYLYHKEELMLYAIISVSVGGVLILIAIIVQYFRYRLKYGKKKEE